MVKKLNETALWQRNLASLIRSGLFDRADVIEYRGLYVIVGIYRDGSSSAPLAKYADRRRAKDALGLVEQLAHESIPAEVN